MRRTLVFATLLLSLLAVMIPSPAQAEPGEFRVKALVTGQTDPDGDPIEPTRRGVGRSAFEGVSIAGYIDCRDDDDVEEHVIADLTSPHKVTFESDDDITDGYGNVDATDDARAFEDSTAVEVREDGLASQANVRVRILGGDFHRLGNVVEVFLRLDIRVERDPDGSPGTGDEELQCETGPDGHEIRIVFLLGPDNDTDVLGGFALTGIARSHELPTDSTNLVRTICRTVGPQTLPPNTVEHNIYCQDRTL